MRSGLSVRRAALPAMGVALISVVLGVQVARGGGDFVPLAAVDPCSVRTVTSVSPGIDGLTERLVLLGLDRAACRLGVPRETFLLQLAQQREPTVAQVNALRVGLNQAVDQLKRDGALPPASDLADQALDRSNLNGFLKAAIRALPDSVINQAVRTDDVLHRTINNVDLRALLTNLSNPDELTRQVDSAVTDAVRQSLEARLRHLP
jgi:hypothetical protein